ncbi:hypothetical protein P7L87_27345, partial [Vibrio parahaemolyticus]|nr:hypothetical protein [Vibrio parahaemolyticus]
LASQDHCHHQPYDPKKKPRECHKGPTNLAASFVLVEPNPKIHAGQSLLRLRSKSPTQRESGRFLNSGKISEEEKVQSPKGKSDFLRWKMSKARFNPQNKG